MSLIDLESFDGLTSDAFLTRWSATQANPESLELTFPSGRTGNCLNIGANGNDTNDSVVISFPTSQFTQDNELYFGFALRHTNGLVDSTSFINIFSLINYSNNIEFGIEASTHNTSAGVIVNNSIQGYISYKPEIWQYYELKFIGDLTSGGEAIIKINNEVVFNYSGDTRYQDAPVLMQFASSPHDISNLQVDDFYCCDSAGSINNGFLGPIRIEALYPNANGSSSDFDGSDGNSTDNYLLVDEISIDDDTTYVESLTTNDKDLYGYNNLSAGDVRSVEGVKIDSYLRCPNAGVKGVSNIVKSNTSEFNGINFLLNSPSYILNTDIVELDPDTSAAWTESGVNALEAGIKING